MLKIAVCYSRKESAEFASCSIGDLELDAALLDQPTAFTAAVRRAYDRAVECVDLQLGGPPAPPAAPVVVNPAVARATAPPPAPSAPSAPTATPAPNGRTYYQKGNGRGQDGPPVTGAQLGAVAKKLGAIPFFQAIGQQQNPPLPKFLGDWPDNMACWAWTVYQASCVPPQAVAPPVPANGAPY
jgi:hypothetical protein